MHIKCTILFSLQICRFIYLLSVLFTFVSIGHNVPIKDTSKYVQDGSTSANGNVHATGEQEKTETDALRSGGMRKSVARQHSAKNDSVHLQRRVGLFSGVALIVGTMIGKIINISPNCRFVIILCTVVRWIIGIL